MVSATADSNIYISALNFGGQPDRFLDMARAGEVKLAISDEIEEEVVRVLRDKFGWSEEALKLLKERLGDFTERVKPEKTVDAVKNDPTDNRIIECALAGGSEYIVTGDKDLLRLGSYGNIRTGTVADFLKVAQGQMRGF